MTETHAKGTSRRWMRRTLGAAIAVVLVAGTAMALVRQPATEVTVEDALRDFRARATSAGGAGSADTVPGTVQRQVATTAPAATPPSPDGAAAGVPQDTSAAPQAPPSTESAAPTGQKPPGPAPAPTAPPAPDPAPPEPGSALPAEGVYTFATKGSGETDALGGARHDYPAEVPLTVTHHGCGYVVRWQPLKERWDEWEFCAAPSSRPMLRISTYHEFFRRPLRQNFDCGGTDMFSHREAGQQYRWKCSSSNSEIDATSHVVGVERLDIGGTPVDAIHVRNEAVFHGANEGSQTFEWWLALDTGLPVKMVRTVQTKSESPFGKVNYREQSTSVATTMTPQR